MHWFAEIGGCGSGAVFAGQDSAWGRHTSWVTTETVRWRGIGQNDLVSHLRTQFEVHADTRCFTFLNESGRHLVPEVTSFGDLDRDARAIAAWLSTRPEADRPVLLLFEPGIDFWRAFLGCLYAGVVAVPTPLPVDERSMKRVAGILRDADSSLALTTEKLRGPLTAGIEGFDLERPLRVRGHRRRAARRRGLVDDAGPDRPTPSPSCSTRPARPATRRASSSPTAT